MLWVWVVVATAVAGLVMLALFAVWLWRKARVLFAELGVLGGHATTISDLVGLIGATPERVVTTPSPDSVD